jgi:hypothetical protein
MENIINISFKYDKEQIIEIDKIINLSPKIIKSKMGWDDPYYQIIKRFFIKQKKEGYTVNDQYRVKNSGRVFGKSTTLQSVDNKILSNLFNKSTYDIDMKNASFNIIKYIIIREFESYKDKFPTLLEYADKRETFYTPLCDKLFFIKSVFCANPLFKIDASFPKKVNDLFKELSEFQNLCNTNRHLWNCDFKDDNHKGQHLCKIIHYYENKILQEIVIKFQAHIKFLKFDGFGISNNCDLENVLLEANAVSGKYGIEMINKKFPDPVLLDEPPVYADKEDLFKEEYDTKKIEFEKNHFIINKPLAYYKVYDEGEYGYNKGDFRDLVAPVLVGDRPFFDRWIKDEDRRQYKEFVWKPVISNNENSPTYNTFKGFNIESEEGEEIDEEVVKEFTEKLILLICGGEIPAQQFVIKFIAHMIQYPEKLPKTALLFKGEEGVGKDLLIDILQGIIGLEYICRDSKMENIAGTFNNSLKNKFIIQLNEVSGKDGHFNKELLKDLITADRLNIREMRTDVVSCVNYMRLFLFTNNINAINISYDDRRYCVFKTGDRQPYEYYDKLHNIKKNKKSLKSIYNYLKNLDIGNFQPDNKKDRVKTLAYEQLQDANRNPFYQFLRDFLELKLDDFIYVEKKQKHYIKMRVIEHYYTNWLYENDYTTESNSKRNKGVLLELGGLEVRATVGNTPTTRYISLDIKKIINILDTKHSFVKPEIIII